MNTVTAAATSNADEVCPRLDATRPVDLTYYRRFLVCVDEKQPGRYVTFPLKSKPGPASSEDGNGRPGLPWFMRHTLKTRKEVHLSKQQRLQLDTKHAEAMEHLWKIFGKRPNDPYWAVGVEYEQRYECQGAHRGRLLGTVPLGLYPATKEITMRSWEKRVEHRVLTESLEKSAEIVGGAIKRTPFTPFTSAAEKIDQAAIERLKGYARRRLREVDAISEAEKQAYFLTSTRATTAILLYEFASGEGHDYRKFDESHAIVQDIKASAFSEEVLRVFGKLNEGAPSIEHLVPLDDRFYGYSFSPDHAGLGESIEKHAEAFEKLGEGSDLELFLGGVSYQVTIDAPNDKLNVLMRDSKTRPSLLLHGAEARERALFKETPLGSTVQEYAFSLPIPWELIYDAGPRAKP